MLTGLQREILRWEKSIYCLLNSRTTGLHGHWSFHRHPTIWIHYVWMWKGRGNVNDYDLLLARRIWWRTQATISEGVTSVRIPGQNPAMMSQFCGSFRTFGIKGQALHIRGLTGWIVQILSFQKTQYPFSAWARTCLLPESWQYFSRNSCGSKWMKTAIAWTSSGET